MPTLSCCLSLQTSHSCYVSLQSCINNWTKNIRINLKAEAFVIPISSSLFLKWIRLVVNIYGRMVRKLPVIQAKTLSRLLVLGMRPSIFWQLCATFNVHGSVRHRNNILIYIQQDATLHSLFYLATSLHVSSVTSTHHQESIQQIGRASCRERVWIFV
jgi:hypothetical protein